MRDARIVARRRSSAREAATSIDSCAQSAVAFLNAEGSSRPSKEARRMKPKLNNLYTAIDGKCGFDDTVELTINQTIKVATRKEAESLLAEYPNAAEWSEEQGGSTCTNKSKPTAVG
jgi:hypothetical protein